MPKKIKKARKASKPKSKPKRKAPAKAKTKKKAPAKKAAAKKKKPAKGSQAPKMSVIPPANSVLLGRVEDYFAHINVIALTVKAPFSLGSKIHILGHTTNLEQTVDSMQIDHQAISTAKAKDAVGIKIQGRSRKGDYVFLLKG